MGQSFSISTNPPLTLPGETSTALDASVTNEYQNLLQSFLEAETQAAPETQVAPETLVEKKETLYEKIFTTNKAEPLNVLKQQTSDKLRGAEQRLISVQNSAIRASTNTTNLSKGLSETLLANVDLLNICKQGLKAAYAMGGGNLELVTTYNKSISVINSYLTTARELTTKLNNSLDLLDRIESTTDLINAEIDNDSNKFFNSINSGNYVNEFECSKKLLDELLETIKKNETPLSKFNGQIKLLIKQIESRSNEINKYLSGPKDPYLQRKDQTEFTKELKTLAANLNMLNLNLLLLPTFGKTIQSIIGQLQGLKTLIIELEEMNLGYVKNQTSQQSASEHSSQTYNGEVIIRLEEVKPNLIMEQIQKV